jgi:hypothetical protein
VPQTRSDYTSEPPHFRFAQLVKLSNGAVASRSGGRPVLDFVLLAPELLDFEFELYCTASVAFSDRFLLFYVSLDERVFYVGYSVPFFLSAIFVLPHCQPPSQNF